MYRQSCVDFWVKLFRWKLASQILYLQKVGRPINVILLKVGFESMVFNTYENDVDQEERRNRNCT